MDSRSVNLGKKKGFEIIFCQNSKGNYHQQIIFIILFFEIIEGFFVVVVVVVVGLRQHEGFVV